jgi:hypothetical protein
MVGWYRHVVNIQTEKHRKHLYALRQSRTHAAARDLTVWKDASNVRVRREEDIILTRYEGNFTTVTLKRRPLTQTVLKALATARKIAPVSLFSPRFLVTLLKLGGPAEEPCYVWVSKQIAHRGTARARIFIEDPTK